MSSANFKNLKSKGTFALYEASLYNVYSNTDTTEGRGSTIKIGSFDNQSDADSFAKGKGIMGCLADVKLEVENILVPIRSQIDYDWINIQLINGKLEPFNPSDPKKRREEILKKLSPEELEILGLK